MIIWYYSHILTSCSDCCGELFLAAALVLVAVTEGFVAPSTANRGQTQLFAEEKKGGFFGAISNFFEEHEDKKERLFKCIKVYIELLAFTFTFIPDCYHVMESSVWG